MYKRQIVVVSEASDEYELWTARMGEVTVNTQSLPDAEAVRYTKQFALGSLFKSQNGTIWTADQYQDLKFKLYKANFTSNSGTAYFYNPTLDESNGYVQILGENPITTLPKTATLGITTAFDATTQQNLVVGRKIVGSNDFVTATVSATGSCVANIGIGTSGANYVSDTNVSTYNIIGSGSGLTLNITAAPDGVKGITNVSLGSTGNGYQQGDVVGIVTSTVSSLSGSGARIDVASVQLSLIHI